MASKKSKLLEQSLQEDVHPFAARQSAEAQVAAEPRSGMAGPKVLKESQLFRKPDEGEARPQALPRQDKVSRPYARTASSRTITRYAFEFFQDQIETLRDFSLDEKMRGDKGSMSQMVREAMD